jgi:hypothetical protein
MDAHDPLRLLFGFLSGITATMVLIPTRVKLRLYPLVRNFYRLGTMLKTLYFKLGVWNLRNFTAVSIGTHENFQYDTAIYFRKELFDHE